MFLAPYPFGRVASQRFRFEQYWDILEENYQVSFHSFLSERSFNLLYTKGNLLKKAIGVLGGFWRRFLLLFQVYKFDFVFIHREASPIGPPFFEWIIAKVFRKKIIYDFDDAIWLSNTSSENRMAALFKCHWKVKYICSWSHKVTCGNDFLSDFAKKFNPNSAYLPTTLDLKDIPIKPIFQKPENKTIGWTGTHSTLKYLDRLLPILKKLQKQYSFNFLVIADKDPKLDLENY
ncbi:MAG: glycosyltransferase family 1 protein, partial [Opitutaceae bacterium]|nr:glycosyltransferase family 1 protein [Cytophagales bacterium]